MYTLECDRCGSTMNETEESDTYYCSGCKWTFTAGRDFPIDYLENRKIVINQNETNKED